MSSNGELAAGEPMVRFKGVTKSYGALTVLDKLDLDVAPNETVAIIGPSGSGKTTVLRMLMTLERINGGVIWVDGEPLTSVGDDDVAVAGPLTRVDFQFGGVYGGVEDQILVEMPRPGEIIEGPSVDVGGSANTYEATVNLEGAAAAGTVLVPEEFTTATSGSGTPGTFTHTLTFPAGTTGPVVVSVYSLSPEDGARQAVDAIPITLE
jgi:energy-coupling factor transporter ATP-binding protein EcfA2